MAVGIFFLPNFIFYRLECSGESNKKIESMKKKSSSRHYLAHPAGGQETTFYLRVARSGVGALPSLAAG